MCRTAAGSAAFLFLVLVIVGWAYADEAKGPAQSQARLVTISFNEVPLGKALQLLSKHGLNYIATKETLDSAPLVTARFKDMPVMAVAKAIVKTAGLYYIIESPGKIRVR